MSDLINKAEALLPCPFCGGEAVDLQMGGLVGCEPCGLARRDAASWNRRADLPARGGKANQSQVTAICEAWVADGRGDECFWEGWPDQPQCEDLTPNMILAALAPTDAAQADGCYPYDGPEQCERDLEDTAAQAREAAARLLLDMLYMRNGAHEGVTRDDAQAMWDAASTRKGYAAVDAFLRSIIGEARAMEGRE